MWSRGVAANNIRNQSMSQGSSNPNPTQDVFEIDLIIHQILKPLNTTELLSCRSVNSTFEHFATETLRSRNSIIIEFVYNWDRRIFAYVSNRQCKITQGQIVQYHGKNIDSRCRTCSRSLDDLTEMLKNKKSSTLNFPSKSFKFSGGPVNDKYFQKFLKIGGCFIEEFYFELNCANDWDPLAKYQKGCGCIKFSTGLRNLLSDYAPNLQSLHLDAAFTKGKYFPNSFYNELDMFQTNFPSLKKLSLGKHVSSNVFRDIFKSSHALERIYVVNEKHSDYAIKKNKFYLFRDLIFSPSKFNIDFYEDHISKQPQILKSRLQSIKIIFCGLSSIQKVKSRIAQVTQDILGASANTLKEIEISSPFGLLCEIPKIESEVFKFPPLPHVTCMKISTAQIQSYLSLESNRSAQPVTGPNLRYSIKNFFPTAPSFKFKSTFPALKTIKFDFDGIKDNSTWDEFFDLSEPVLTVKSLIFSKATFLPINSLTNCHNLFPNVECLTIRTLRLSIHQAALNGLWNFQKLKQLKMDIHLEWGGNGFPSLDAAFTGFDLRTCIEFRKCVHGINAGTIADCRVNPSILQLKELESLQMTIVDKRKLPGSRLYEHQRILSRVTGDYGFKMCPKLRVELDFQVKCEINLKKIQENLRPLHRRLHLTTLLREADD